MKANEYAELKKLAKEALTNGTLSADDAVKYILLLEKSQANDVLKICQKVIREDAAGRKMTYRADLGTVDVGEPYVKAVNEEDFKRDKPEAYKNIIAKKAENLHLTLEDLSKDDKEKYVHYVKGTAKVRVNLA